MGAGMAGPKEIGSLLGVAWWARLFDMRRPLKALLQLTGWAQGRSLAPTAPQPRSRSHSCLQAPEFGPQPGPVGSARGGTAGALKRGGGARQRDS